MIILSILIITIIINLYFYKHNAAYISKLLSSDYKDEQIVYLSRNNVVFEILPFLFLYALYGIFLNKVSFQTLHFILYVSLIVFCLYISIIVKSVIVCLTDKRILKCSSLNLRLIQYINLPYLSIKDASIVRDLYDSIIYITDENEKIYRLYGMPDIKIFYKHLRELLRSYE